MNIDPSIRKLLDNEATIHEAQIRALFQTLDRRFGLRGASVPIRFGYDEAVLGSYTPASSHEKEGFYFSLLFIGYAVKKPLSKEERSSATVTFSTESTFVPFVLGFLTLVLRGENRRILNSGLNIITVRNPEVNILFDTLRNQKIGNAVFISISDPFNLIARGGFEPSTLRV